ncbi:hypothetical protein HDU98_001914, partial [Podochytrium sp. JEL0797]
MSDDHATQWPPTRVAQWVTSLGLAPQLLATALAAFASNDVSGDALLSLDAHSLKSELGISSYGLRFKLSTAIAQLRQNTMTRPDSPAPAPLLPAPLSNSIPLDQSDTSPCFIHSPNFISCPSLRDPPIRPTESALFNLARTSTTDAIPTEPDKSFFFKRIRGSSSAGASRSLKPPAILPNQRPIQRKLKRLLASPNLIVFDQESIRDDPIIRDLFESKISRSAGGRGGSNAHQAGVVGVWVSPSRDSGARKLARVFRKLPNGDIIDFVDNSGQYEYATPQRTLAPSQQPFGFTHSSQHNDSSFELPLYGDSDIDEYESDSEWEREIQQSERAKLAAAETSATADASKPSPGSHKPSNPSTTNRTEPDEINLDAFQDMDLNHQKPPPPTRDEPIPSSPLPDHQIPFTPSSSQPIPTASSNDLRALLESTLSDQQTTWQTTILPTLLPSAHRLYANRTPAASLLLKSQLHDLTERRLPKLVDALLDGCNGSRRDLVKGCENLRVSVYSRCELEWKVSVLEAGKAPEGPRPEKKARNKERGGKEDLIADLGSDEEETDGDESDGMGDFIAPEDDEIEDLQQQQQPEVWGEDFGRMVESEDDE